MSDEHIMIAFINSMDLWKEYQLFKSVIKEKSAGTNAECLKTRTHQEQKSMTDVRKACPDSTCLDKNVIQSLTSLPRSLYPKLC